MACKIALVDSGIDLKLYEKYVTEYIVLVDKEEEPIISDANGHGTLCCSALLNINSDVEIVAVQVLNELNQCSSESLILGLEQLVDSDVNIINLSLSTKNLQYLWEYTNVLNKLVENGKIILAASSNRNHHSVLASLPQTVGIEGKIFLRNEDYWYQNKKKIQCVTNSIPTLLQGAKGNYELFGGNSKATALFCGIISKCWNELKDLTWEEKEYFMQKNANRTNWGQENLLEEIDVYQISQEKKRMI